MARVGNKEEKEVTRWFERIKMGESFRNSDGRKEAWQNMRKYYKNQFEPGIIAVNLIYSHGRQLIPSLYFNNPVIECSALFPGWEAKAKIQEAVDNMLLEKMRLKEQLKLIIQDAYLYDYGIRKVGYDAEFGYDPTSSIWKQLFDELGFEMPQEELAEFNSFITREFPFFLRVPPNRFVVDPDVDGPGFETARWVAECFYRPLDEVIEDKRYEHIPKDLQASYVINAQGNSVVISPKKEGIDYGDQKFGRDRDRVKLWEVWDKEERRVRVIIEGVKGFARDIEDVWNLENFFPYDRLCFNPISDEHYSVSDAMYIERLQIEYNEATTQENMHRKKENLKIIAEENVFSEEEMGKLNSGQIGIVALARPSATGPAGKVMTLAPSMSRDIPMGKQQIRDDIREILAFGPNQLGQEMGRRKTASEALIIDQAVKLRSDERRDLIADFLKRAVNDLHKIIHKFWDTTDVVEVIGPEGAEWVEWSGEMLEGNYGLRIVPNSVLPTSKEAYKQRCGELVQLYRNDPYIDQRELRRLHLDSYEEFNTGRLLLPSPDPTQVMAFINPGEAKHGDGSTAEVPMAPEAVNTSGAAMGAGGAPAGPPGGAPPPMMGGGQ